MKAIETTVALSMDAAEEAVREALADHGFGVMTEMDVAAALEAKLGVQRAPLKILGACNPNFAHEALKLDPSVALLLPCNVVLESQGDETKVAAVDPRELMDDPAFADLAADVAAKLTAAVESLGA